METEGKEKKRESERKKAAAAVAVYHLPLILWYINIPI